MADTLQTLSLLVLSQNYKPGLVRQINRQATGLKCLQFVAGEGKNVAFAPQASGAVAENFAEGADAANFGSDGQTSAILNWGMYRSNFHVSGLAMATSSTSTSPEGNLKLWANNMSTSMAVLAGTINGLLYTGAGTGTTIAGLDVAIGSATNTYATIDRTVGANAFWIPSVFAPGAPTALTLALIRSDLATIFTACGTRPDLALVHPNVFNKIAGLFDELKQYVLQVDTARGVVSLDGSAGAINIDGCMFVEDKDATDGKIYYVNTSHVRFMYLPMNLSIIPGMTDEIMELFADDGFGVTPLGVQMEMLAKSGDSEKATMKTYIQLVCDQPNSCGVRSNIA